MNERAPTRIDSVATDVSFVIVTCNRRDLLRDCVSALDRLDYPRERTELVVYDNGSRDGSVEWLRRNRPDARILRAASNTGFAAPNNRAAREARGRFLCLVNNDVQLAPDALRELLRAQAETGAACVGARLLSAGGDRIEFDGGSMSFYGHAAPLAWGRPFDADAAAESVPVASLFACGAAMLVNRQAFLDAGGFDASYFAYYEDVDLGWRFWLLGERCVVAPRALARHREHASESLLPANRRLELLEQNALLTIYKNYERERGERAFRCALALLAERARLDRARANACWRGLAGALLRLPGAETARRVLETRRVRSDAEVAALFREPLRPAIGDGKYATRQHELACLFGAADLFASEMEKAA